MIFRLEHLVPLPLQEQDLSHSQVWDRKAVVFESGQHYLVEAPSGKGKTSLLSVLYGLRKDYGGKLSLDEQAAESLNEGQWTRLRKEKLAFVFQGLELFADLTALENIQLKNRISSYRTTTEIRDMAERLGIGAFLNRKTGIISFGQQQRVAILRALCQPFEFFLADECFSHMDRKNSEIAFELISEESRKQEAGLILTSLGSSQQHIVDRRLSL